MANKIIERRIIQLEAKKRELLKMKKADRNDQLKGVNDTISRLKRWDKEEEVRMAQKQWKSALNPERIPRKNVLNINKAIQAFKNLCEANPQWDKQRIGLLT